MERGMGYKSDSLAEEYSSKGFVIVDDFLPEEIASSLEALYSNENNEWTFQNQVALDFQYSSIFFELNLHDRATKTISF